MSEELYDHLMGHIKRLVDLMDTMSSTNLTMGVSLVKTQEWLTRVEERLARVEDHLGLGIDGGFHGKTDHVFRVDHGDKPCDRCTIVKVHEDTARCEYCEKILAGEDLLLDPSNFSSWDAFLIAMTII